MGSIFFPAKELRIKKREVKMIRRLLLFLCILSIPLVFVNAQPERPSGHILICWRYQEEVEQCSVRCYNAYTGQHVVTGYTNDYPCPPWYHRCRFSINLPGCIIPSGPNCVYKYYCKRFERPANLWEYSEWSPPMPYKEPGYLDYQVLSLRWLTPPPMEELYEARPEE